MKTASGHLYKGAGRIAISLGTRGFPAGYRKYLALAPTPELFRARLEYEAFEERYILEILDKLDAMTVVGELVRLAAPYEPVLLCHEDPGVECHRIAVSNWLWEQLELEVPEIGLEGIDDYSSDEVREKAIMVQRTTTK